MGSPFRHVQIIRIALILFTRSSCCHNEFKTSSYIKEFFNKKAKPGSSSRLLISMTQPSQIKKNEVMNEFASPPFH